MNIEQLVKENNKLLHENNALLKKMRSMQRWHAWSRVVYWLVLLALAFGAYFWVQPYLENIQSAYQDFVVRFNQAGQDLEDFSQAKENLEESVQGLIPFL